ncbi:sugar kinase [Glutamicibacter nicotianae]
MSGIITIGESLGLVYGSRTGGFDFISDASVSFGGAESNVAIAARRLGAETTWIGRVGDDALGQRIVKTIRGEGITTVAAVDSNVPTALMLKDRPAAGRTRVEYYRSGNAGSRLSISDVPQDVLAEADIFHFTGIALALSPESAETVFAAAQAAKRSGAIVSFDFNYRSKLWTQDEASAAYRQVLEFADIVFAGDDEASIVTGNLEPENQAMALAEFGPSEVIIKLGERGAYAREGQSEWFQTPYSVEVADTVGAGDAFVGGYLAERLNGLSLDARMRTAAAAGACACRGEGDWEMMPTRREIEELVEDRDPVDR